MAQEMLQKISKNKINNIIILLIEKAYSMSL